MTIQLIYMARPAYGGWVSFTAHLALKHNLPLYKIGNRTEQSKEGEPKYREFGYGVNYQNRAIDDLPKGKILITAIDKTYYEFIPKLPDGTFLVIHDPTEVSGKSAAPLVEHLHRFKLITIRESVKEYLQRELKLKSRFIIHPFFEYPYKKAKRPEKAISISRVDFDKHTDIILKANKILDNPIDIYGAINRQYVFFVLKKLGFEKYYKGTFPKDFESLSSLMENVKYIVDMSVIKHDGGGSQYTFLEAIYQECVLIINKKWIENQKTNFVHKKNCFVIADENELADILEKDPPVKSILAESKKLLEPHLRVNWIRELSYIK